MTFRCRPDNIFKLQNNIGNIFLFCYCFETLSKMFFAIISKIKALIVYLGVDTIYSCPLLGLSMCTKYAEKYLKLKKIVYGVALVLIYSVGRKHFCYKYKRPLQTSFLINDQTVFHDY